MFDWTHTQSRCSSPSALWVVGLENNNQNGFHRKESRIHLPAFKIKFPILNVMHTLLCTYQAMGRGYTEIWLAEIQSLHRRRYYYAEEKVSGQSKVSTQFERRQIEISKV
jgi:hypothetical protein